MFEELRAYLAATTTPEYTETAMTSCELLTRAGLFSHEEGLLRLLEISENVDTAQTITDIDYTLRDYLDEVLAMFSLTLGEDTPIPLLNGAVEAMLSLPNYGDPDTVLGILQSDINDEEILCALMGLASDHKAEHYLPYLQSYSASLLTQLESVANTLVIDSAPETDQGPIRERLKRFVARYPGALVDHAIRDGKALGTEFHELIEDYQDDLDQLTNKPEELAKQLVGFILATPLADDELRQALADELEEVIESINVLTKVSLSINRYLAEVLIDDQA